MTFGRYAAARWPALAIANDCGKLPDGVPFIVKLNVPALAGSLVKGLVPPTDHVVPGVAAVTVKTPVATGVLVVSK